MTILICPFVLIIYLFDTVPAVVFVQDQQRQNNPLLKTCHRLQ
ncbi:hypothetical protein [Chitinophaga nivalis]|uniref:Uncharacterized protein n=1 Tax=Chitinophaga nivalis TaxID=2991709 RepID=A0ABT3IJN5_9BACT|nr:hypothetical protein [Chitinophaga nivalis]MCW3466124.1 hypothetical protein [Chitinophaga nivalis]MCW3484185.1 hypothetical protein [Chitinophaga nivalis]